MYVLLVIGLPLDDDNLQTMCICVYNLFWQSPTRDELLERLLECDVVVYNISESVTQEQVEEATWAITGKEEVGVLLSGFSNVSLLLFSLSSL